MKRTGKFTTAIITGCFLLLLAGCSKEPPALQSLPQTQKENVPEQTLASAPITQEDITALMSDDEKSWMNLTTADYLEDFDYLYQAMKDNYPYFGVVKRKVGLDIETEYQKTREIVGRCSNDHEYWQTVRAFIRSLDYTGHISAWGTRYSTELESTYEFIEIYPQYAEHYAPYIQALENPASHQFYSGLETFLEVVESRMPPEEEPEESAIPEESVTSDLSSGNIVTDIIEDNHIAYISIAGMDMMAYEQDRDDLLAFYREVADYDHLIIDITQNGGGGMSYYSDLVVAPNIDQPLSVNVYCLIKDGTIVHDFLITPGLDEWKPINELPELPNINREDLAQMAYFTDEPYTIEPSGEGRIFQGKIWLLVSEYNYSSSEYAAMFSKHSGFATLVGAQTGGDGIGTDPIYIILPHTGLVIQFSPIYGISQDGTGSEEYGTTPDHFHNPGETALEACLRLITNQTE